MAANVNYNLRNSHNIHVPFNRLSVYQNSYIPCTIQAWNSLDLTIRNFPTFSSFKLKLQQLLFTERRNPQYYSISDRFPSVLHARIRNKCSALNADWYHANLIVNYNCLCGSLRVTLVMKWNDHFTESAIFPLRQCCIAKVGNPLVESSGFCIEMIDLLVDPE